LRFQQIRILSLRAYVKDLKNCIPFERKGRCRLRYDKKDMIIIGYVRPSIDGTWKKDLCSMKPSQYDAAHWLKI